MGQESINKTHIEHMQKTLDDHTTVIGEIKDATTVLVTQGEHTNKLLEKLDEHREISDNRTTTLEVDQKWLKAGVVGTIVALFGIFIKYITTLIGVN